MFFSLWPKERTSQQNFWKCRVMEFLSKDDVSFLSLSHYKGVNDKDAQPLAFVGKGVTFDSGGISLKPGAVCFIFLTYRHSLIIRNTGHEINAWRYGQVCNQGPYTSIDFSIFLRWSCCRRFISLGHCQTQVAVSSILVLNLLICSYLPQYQSYCQHSSDRKHARTKCH